MDLRDTLFNEIFELMDKDENIVFLTADTGAHGLQQIKNKFSDRFIDMGVAEQNMINVASGIAMTGKLVFVYSIIPFLTMRCYEQIKLNVCSMKLPIVLLGLGAGLSFSYDGPTHHGISDISLMRTIPDLDIWNPIYSFDMEKIIELIYEKPRPSYIRIDKTDFELPKGINVDSSDHIEPTIGYNTYYTRCFDDELYQPIIIISSGYMAQGANQLLAGNPNLNLTHINIIQLRDHYSDFGGYFYNNPIIIIMEEHIGQNSLTDIIKLFLQKNNIQYKKLIEMNLDNKNIWNYGSREYLHEYYNIDLHNFTLKILETSLLKGE